jgi:simple sugar transport system ATP-binding protein
LPPRLEPLDLELRVGEIVVLAGVDGNGQVAAAERLAGLSNGPGEIEVGGKRLVVPTPSQLRRLGVWVIPKDRTREGLAPSLSVAENMVLGRHRGGAWRRGPLLDREAVRAEGERLVSRFGVVGEPGQAVAQLSGGNQQKVVVARAVAAQPRVLVAIHPTRGLDVTAAATVRTQLVAAAEGAAVLVVTSDLEEALEIADRILVLSRGRVVGVGGRGTPMDQLARWVGGEAA